MCKLSKPKKYPPAYAGRSSGNQIIYLQRHTLRHVRHIPNYEIGESVQRVILPDIKLWSNFDTVISHNEAKELHLYQKNFIHQRENWEGIFIIKSKYCIRQQLFNFHLINLMLAISRIKIKFHLTCNITRHLTTIKVGEKVILKQKKEKL